MADNVAITPGAGATIATDDVSGVQFQKVKIDGGGDGASVPLVIDASYGVPVDIKRSAAVPVTDNGGALTIDDGGGTVSVDDGGGTLTVDSPQLPAALVGGALAVAVAQLPAALDGSGNLKVAVQSSSVTNQEVVTDKSGFTEGTGKAAVAGAVYNDTISSDPSEDQAAALRMTAKRALHVQLRTGAVEAGTSGNPLRTDPTGSTTQPTLDTNSAAIKTAVELMDDAVATLGSATPAKGLVAAGHDGTNARALSTQTNGHVNIHDGGNSITVDDGGGSVTVDFTNGPVNLAQVLGSAISAANGLPVTSAPTQKAQVNKEFSSSASAAANQALWTPTGGTRFVVRQLVIQVTTGGVLKIFDDADSSGRYLYKGTISTGLHVINMPEPGFVSGAINRVLRYTVDGTIVVEASVWGYEV